MATTQPLTQAAHDFLKRSRLHAPPVLVDRFLKLGALDELCALARRAGGDCSFFYRLLASLNLSYECPQEDIARIPLHGAAVIVANHPFGLAEGPILGDLLLSVRPDFRFMANSLLAAVPELLPYLFAVDPSGRRDAARQNASALRSSIEWLKSGGLLVVFPAGEVSSLRLPAMRIEDPAWNGIVARIIRLTGALAVPLFFHGSNSPGFQAAGMLHPGLRTALLPHELLNKRGSTIQISVGRPVPPDRLSALPREFDAIEYLRSRTHLLEGRHAAPRPPRRSAARPERVMAPVAANLVAAEIGALPESARLLDSGSFSVLLADAPQIPHALREIGRLRELTFRQCGEGTGRPLDLDGFDDYYRHLFIWSRERGEIVGAYRFAETSRVVPLRGARGLYTNSLFHYGAKFLASLEPGLELGRSFVRAEYQKGYQPLLLLWKGIGRFVAGSPRYRFLFGPVSISGDYSDTARELMVAYLRSRCSHPRLASMVRARSPFRPRPLRSRGAQDLCSRLAGIDDLGEAVADVESGKRALPVLLRQYLNVGGRIVDFSTDASFSGVLDGLIVVDLLETDRKLLKRYLGMEGAAAFLSHHGAIHG